MRTGIAAIIFDLDGTLIDSLEDLADTVNHALGAHNLPKHPVEAYKYFVGDGMETLVRRAAPENTPDSLVQTLLARVKETYGQNWAKKTRPYDGIMELLRQLSAKGIALAVLSNKPHEFTGEIVEHFFPQRFFPAQGLPAGCKAKPDPTLALDIAKKLSLEPARIAFMGDSRTDMDTAGNAGMLPVGVLWGFRLEKELRDHGAKIIAAHPSDLIKELSTAGFPLREA
ncbi:phosphoglycolate phosphatase [Deltaproteobacteria bacterium]|nr:phosphoglycolate phosphatase [Deltaproteobacteria bacterium]